MMKGITCNIFPCCQHPSTPYGQHQRACMANLLGCQYSGHSGFPKWSKVTFYKVSSGSLGVLKQVVEGPFKPCLRHNSPCTSPNALEMGNFRTGSAYKVCVCVCVCVFEGHGLY